MRLGTIRSLKPNLDNEEQSHGYVDESGHARGLFFMASAIQEGTFAELKVGDEVQFKLGDDANTQIFHLIRGCSNQDSRIKPSINAASSGAKVEPLALRSKIASLTPEADNKGYGFILKLDKGSNYHFTWSELVDCAFSELKVGDEVQFELDKIGNGKVLALRLVNHENRLTPILPIVMPESSPPKKLPPLIKKTTLIESLIDVLSVIPEISEPDKFEDAVFMLLKMLGISNVYQYGRTEQAGKADGFFHFKNLAVLYDCTLREDFFSFKEEQIDNYVGKLSKSPLTMQVRKSDGGKLQKKFQLDQKSCHVWIITTGNKTRDISATESIRVKEVTVQDLIKLAKRRLHADTFDDDELLRQLQNIEHG